MKKPQALILRVAGINCEKETKFACEKAGFQADILHLNQRKDVEETLKKSHLIVFPGGFSYGDDLGAGRVLSIEVRERLGSSLRKFVEEGKLILGICNGFQTLVQTGLLAAPSDGSEPVFSLTENNSRRFEARWVSLKIRASKSEFLIEEDVIQLPVAHAEGKFVTRDDSVLKRLLEEDRVVLQYADSEGNEVGYPGNPNGSDGNVAGICDATGRVLGLMPHPERFYDAFNHPRWTRTGTGIRPDGLMFFENACEYVRRNLL